MINLKIINIKDKKTISYPKVESKRIVHKIIIFLKTVQVQFVKNLQYLYYYFISEPELNPQRRSMGTLIMFKPIL